LIDRRVEVYADPNPQGYGALVTHDPSSELTLFLAGRERGRFAAGELLPEPKPS